MLSKKRIVLLFFLEGFSEIRKGKVTLAFLILTLPLAWGSSIGPPK